MSDALENAPQTPSEHPIWLNPVIKASICRYSDDKTLAAILRLSRGSFDLAVPYLYLEVEDFDIVNTLALTCDENRYWSYSKAVRSISNFDLTAETKTRFARLLLLYPQLLSVWDGAFGITVSWARGSSTSWSEITIAFDIGFDHFDSLVHEHIATWLPSHSLPATITSVNAEVGTDPDDRRRYCEQTSSTFHHVVTETIRPDVISKWRDLLIPLDFQRQRPVCHLAELLRSAPDYLSELDIDASRAVGLPLALSMKLLMEAASDIRRLDSLHYVVRWPDDMAIRDMLNVAVPNWTDTPLQPEPRSDFTLVLELAIKHSTRHQDPWQQRQLLFTKHAPWLRVVASAMLAIGGPTSTYEITVTKERPIDDDDDEERDDDEDPAQIARTSQLFTDGLNMAIRKNCPAHTRESSAWMETDNTSGAMIRRVER